MIRDGERAFATGSLPRRMVWIALPLMLSAGIRYCVELSNVYWVGKLGVVPLSIVTALGTFMSLSKMFAGLTSAGTSAVVGRMVGEGRRHDAIRTAQKVSALALVLGVLVSLVGLGVSPWALEALGLAGEMRARATRYLYLLLLGLPFAFGTMSINGVLVGLGLPRASMRTSLSSLAVGFVMTPLMLRGFGVDVWGAGVAQVAGDACGYFVGLRLLLAHAGPRARLPWKRRLQKLHELMPVLRVGAPLTADAVIHGGVWFALVSFLSSYGSEYVAAQGAEERLTQVLNLPTEGIAPAAATLVGFLLGEGRRREARRVVGLALAMVATTALGGVTLLRLTPAPVVAWLCNDPAFVHVGTQVLAIAALGLAFVGGRDVLEAAFGGVANTVPPVVVGLVTALTRFPLAYVLAVRMGRGGLGVALAVNTTIVVQTLALAAWFFARFDRMRAERLRAIAHSMPPPSPAE